MINDLLDGELSGELNAVLQPHLSGCENCRNYLNSTAILVNKISQLQKEFKHGDLWKGIEKSVLKTKGRETEMYLVSSESNIQKETELIKPFRLSFKYIVTGAAAALLLATLIYTFSLFNNRPGGKDTDLPLHISTGNFWKLKKTEGKPVVSGRIINENDSITEEQWIMTDSESVTEIQMGNSGTIKVERNSKIHVLKTAAGNSRLRLDYGSIDADIKAVPKTFFIETSSAIAIDLGCSYRLTTDTSGDGILYVRSGLVALQSPVRESIVPAGKYCITRKDFGPGTPFSEGISSEMRKALMQFDFGECGSKCVRTIVNSAGKNDAVTLLNILPRVSDEYKQIVYEKASVFCPPPKTIHRDSLMKLDKIDKLNDWIVIVIEDIHKNVDENMQNLDKQMQKLDKKLRMKINFGSDKWQEEWKENFNKNKDEWKKWQFEFNDSLNGFESEEFEKEMEKLNEDLREMHIEIQKNDEIIKIEMEKLKKELKEMNEEIKENLKNMKIEIETKDSLINPDEEDKRVIIKIKTGKNNNDENNQKNNEELNKEE
jgi:hypothetical protein